jgi:putative membrane protein (TIGR04086 family)
MRWGRAIAGGFLAEALLMVAVIPGIVLDSQTTVIWIAVIGSAIMTFVAALWVARRLESGFVAHGAIVGVTAMLMYLAIMAATGSITEQPLVYWVAHGLKVLGGVLGGVFAARRVAGGAAVAAST